MMTIEKAKTALERIRIAVNAGTQVNPEDVEILIGYFVSPEEEKNDYRDRARGGRNRQGKS